MADLFELTQLASYMQQDLDQASAELARALTTALIRAEVGATRYDALTDLSPFLPVALEVARRVLLNPAGIRSESIDDYQVTYAAEVLGGAALTESERAQVLAAAGIRVSGTFTIRPAGTPDRYCWRG
ncbi:hypothetical protein OG271_03990 [Micromonospora rifamycinica]|uniref:hypothetical protein n=1 Tax=Micromonospora rifamycinica TaxID=291594 RepID=UPI002E2E1D5B|nr:hypothetical protein [Micromonospora rifamycinica]